MARVVGDGRQVRRLYFGTREQRECDAVDAAQREARRMCRAWWEYAATMDALLLTELRAV